MAHGNCTLPQSLTVNRQSVGVVIPTFNAANFIPEAIESVLNQSRLLDQIIVVDDGSGDHTEHVVKRFAHKGVQYVRQHNQGSAAARNTGIRLLSTDYVAFLDTDDRWLPNKTATQTEIFMRDPEIGIVSGDQIFWDPDREIRKIRRFSEKKKKIDLRKRLALKNVIGNPSMVMVRRSLFDDVGLFDSNLRFGDDWDMWIRIATISDVAFATQPVAIYRWHTKNQSQSHQAACLNMYRQISRRAIKSSISKYKRPLAYLFLLRHTVLFMRYKSLRFFFGSFFRRIVQS